MATTIQITINIPDCSPLEKSERIKAAEAVASLPMDDIGRIKKLSQNNKALAGLKKHWSMLNQMF